MVIKTALDLTVEWVSVDVPRPDPSNPRYIAPADAEALAASIGEFGLVQPLILRREDNTIIAGHQRHRAAIARGQRRVPVVYLDITAERSRALGLALNKISGTWDDPMLARMLADLRAQSIDLNITGFAEDEVDRFLASLRAQERCSQLETFDLDAAMAAAARTGRTSVGELWALGEHRLAVGDALDPAVIDRVLAGRRPSLTVTDPPYGVGYGHHGGQGRRSRRRTMQNDGLPPEQWALFLDATARLVVERTDGAIYLFMSSRSWPLVCAALQAAGGHWSDTLIYRKDRFVLGRADYQRSYEPIWYGWREGARHHWCGDRDQTDIWEFDRPTDSPAHPTAKPLGLIERAITNSSRPGDLVFDPFAGSGTTLIAAERTGRRCATVELDPIYADVIVARWESFCDEPAVRLDAAAASPEPVP